MGANILKSVLSFQRTAVIVGARQCGKTSLVKNEMPVLSKYMTLDDSLTLHNAKEDPSLFVKQAINQCLVIDEIQKASSLISEIKMRVDEDNRCAQFVMTESADYRKLPQATDSLAGVVFLLGLEG